MMIYLDSAATTEIDPRVLVEMLPYLTDELYGNPGSLHSMGATAKQAVCKARERTALIFGCDPDNVIFTSGGTEGNNMVFAGLRRVLTDSGKRHLVVSAIEHDSVLRAAENLTKDGFYITYVQPDRSGCITPEAVEAAITPATGLVSVMFTNNETGAVNDVAGIGEVCKRHGVMFHCDCVQAAGQYEIDVERYNIDFATISAHKIHGPKGVGAIYIRNVDSIEPMIHGGAYQEIGLRGGTENVAGDVGLGAACGLAVSNLQGNVVFVSTLKQMFVRALADEFGVGHLEDVGITVNGMPAIDPGKVLSLTVDGVYGESLVVGMDSCGVCISSGSACCEHESTPSHVLTAMGKSDVEARSTVRVSFSKFNTYEEVAEAAKKMAECISALRSVSKEALSDGQDEVS